MAKDHELVKSRLTVFIDTSYSDDWATAKAAMTPIALAQSYNLDETGDTQEVVDLADTDSDWSNPEVSKKSWTLSCDSLLLRNNASSGTLDIETKYKQHELVVGDLVWVAIADVVDEGADQVNDGLPYSKDMLIKYGRAVVTSVNRSGTVNDFHTVSATFSGKGALRVEDQGTDT